MTPDALPYLPSAAGRITLAAWCRTWWHRRKDHHD